ncbi:D-alanyl-D-alanine carboxypeptidase [Trinickia violacea]|nr:D-alanyl-D-alanine carboxypeptidase [Trinickia violacea]
MSRRIVGAIAACLACAGLLVSGGGGSVTLDPIVAIMSKPRYVAANSQWSMVVMDAASGSVLYSVDPDVLSYTGSVRKLFSVGTALDEIGPSHQFETPVYRNGTVSAGGTLPMAGYIDAKSGRRLTFALFVNHAGPLTAFTDTLDVYDDEAQILGIVYDSF